MRELSLRLAQRFRGLRQLARPFRDSPFELLVELLELALGSLEHGRFENVPTPVSPREDELVRAHDIQNLRSPGPFERVRA